MSDGTESDAPRTISSIRRLQAQHAAKNRGEYASDFRELFRAVNPDEYFGLQNRLEFEGDVLLMNGYDFEMKVSVKKEFFSLSADPLETCRCKTTGTRHLYTDSMLSTATFTEENRPANADDPPM